MLNRIDSEKREYEILSESAAKAADSRGRKLPEEKCTLRTDFQRDRDRIIHSKALRRLMHKTQVFLAPEGDHFRTRLTHTLEVNQISGTIARALCLNEDLTEAIAMGHDLGHTPFGHNGEEILNEIYPGGFKHNIQSLRVVDVLESSSGKRGMNLTEEVRDGIKNHTGKGIPFTLEGQVVKISDRIAYINHDIDDAIRSNVISSADLPPECVKVLGDTKKLRIDTLVTDLVRHSDGKDQISQGEECAFYMNELRNFMFKNVYHNDRVKKNEELEKVELIIKELYNYYMNHSDQLPGEYRAMIDEFGVEEMVKDQIAGMTDRYAVETFTRLFIPESPNG